MRAGPERIEATSSNGYACRYRKTRRITKSLKTRLLLTNPQILLHLVKILNMQS